MVQQNLDSSSHQPCQITPVAPVATTAHDASFITSSVRKRKDKDIPDINPSDKRTKQNENPAPQPKNNNIDKKHTLPVQHQKEDTILFSPHFHLQHDHPAVDVHPTTDNVSTDASTGTSASVDKDTDSGIATTIMVDEARVQMYSTNGPSIDATTTIVRYRDMEDEDDTHHHQLEEEEEDNDDDDHSIEFDPYVFIKRLPPLHECIPPRTAVLLPRQTRRCKKKTLVLDLDETLVHSTLDGECVPDFTFSVSMGTICHMVAVRKRPHLDRFLERVSKLFEVVVFTASQQIYAEQLLDIIDPGRKLIRHRVYRDSCVLWEGNYLKDLTVLGRDLAHTLIIDNSPQAFGFQLENGVPIESWYDDENDVELLKMIPFLERVAVAEDVRPVIAGEFGLKELVESVPLLGSLMQTTSPVVVNASLPAVPALPPTSPTMDGAIKRKRS